MLHLYTDNASPDGYKILIALEEAGIDYQLHFVDLEKGDNKQPSFLALNPHGRVPVLVDDVVHVTIFESGVILLYLADRFKNLTASDTVLHWQAVQWMVYHSASVGPMIGQYFNFAVSEKGQNQEATARFKRLVGGAFMVIDSHLEGKDFFVGEHLTIADIAHFGWFYSMKVYNVPFDDYPNIVRWYENILVRPAVQRAINHPDLKR